MGNPWPPKFRVGAFSHLEAIYTTHGFLMYPIITLGQGATFTVHLRLAEMSHAA